MTSKICLQCSDEYYNKNKVSLSNWVMRRFCSKACSQIGRKHSAATKAKMRKAKLGKKASKETLLIMSKAQKGKKHHWGFAFFTGKKHTRETCKKMSDVHLGKIASETTKEKMRVCRGEEHHRWIKDRTKLVTNEKKHLCSRYKEWMKSVRDRDKWTCRIADNNCKGRLETHHILRWSKFPELRYEVNNGITLCAFHHPRKINDEEILTPYFKELVNQVK